MANTNSLQKRFLKFDHATKRNFAEISVFFFFFKNCTLYAIVCN